MTRREHQSQAVIEAFLARKEGLQMGGHFYPRAPFATSNCQNGCGAWMGPARSGAPEDSDIDPHGACPLAPGPI